MTLNTIAYAEQVVKDKVLLPDLTALGPGFRIVGVMIYVPPENLTTSTGITYKHWVLAFYISTQPFVNGSTTNIDLFNHSILMSENSYSGQASSYDFAKGMLTPGQSCVIHMITSSSTTTSTTSTCAQNQVSDPGQLIKIRNTYVAVHPTAPNAEFAIDGLNREIVITPAGFPPLGAPEILSSQQVLGLAGSMIP
jgi:hypothetical protein